MECRHHPVLRIIEQHRYAIGNANANHDAGLIADDAIALQPLKMLQIVVGAVNDQQVHTMHLVDGHQLIQTPPHGARQQAAVPLHRMHRVEGAAPQVERIVGGA
jgi:hypothetical protein